MAKLPPKKEEGNSQEWLNTYADMVTLLLTFFVLLFASSNLDETKMQYIFQAFQMRGKYVNQFVSQEDPNAQGEGGNTDQSSSLGDDGELPQSYDELYQYLAEYIDDNNLSDMISIENNAAYFTLRFDSQVFFDGDSYWLKQEGKKLLDDISPAIRAIQSSIRMVTVTGHTSVGSSMISDWTLSSQRAYSVTNYLDDPGKIPMVESHKYRTKGCGNTEPYYSNDTPEGRRKNRRVEMVMLKEDLDLTDPDVIRDMLEHDYGLGTSIFDPNNTQNKDYENLPEGSIDKIIGFINDKYNGSGATHVGVIGPGAVDGSMFIASSDESGSSAGGDSAGGADQSD